MSRFAAKSTWTMEEDAKLCELTEEVGLKQWSIIARSLPGRTGKQVRACAPLWCADPNDLSIDGAQSSERIEID